MRHMTGTRSTPDRIHVTRVSAWRQRHPQVPMQAVPCVTRSNTECRWVSRRAQPLGVGDVAPPPVRPPTAASPMLHRGKETLRRSNVGLWTQPNDGPVDQVTAACEASVSQDKNPLIFFLIFIHTRTTLHKPPYDFQSRALSIAEPQRATSCRQCAKDLLACPPLAKTGRLLTCSSDGRLAVVNAKWTVRLVCLLATIRDTRRERLGAPTIHGSLTEDKGESDR